MLTWFRLTWRMHRIELTLFTLATLVIVSGDLALPVAGFEFVAIQRRRPS